MALTCSCQDCDVYGCSIWCEYCFDLLVNYRNRRRRYDDERDIDEVKVNTEVL